MTVPQESYLDGRAELGKHCLELLQGTPGAKRILSHVFWENFWCDEKGTPQTLFYDAPLAKKQNVQSFDTYTAPLIEKKGNFSRLCVTANWVLEMGSFDGLDSWFGALSGKTRKKLRWLRNALPKENISIVPIDSEDKFRLFEKLYSSQFPKYAPGGEDNNGVWKIYQELEKQQRNFSFLLLDAQGNPVAANLGYINGSSFNFTHLTRTASSLDKYSPGFYLTYWLIQELFTTRPEVKCFFMGPGTYDYKPALLGKPLPVYRYVKISLFNLPELLRLRWRYKKELRRFKEQSAAPNR